MQITHQIQQLLTEAASAEKCQKCDRNLTSFEIDLGWPIAGTDEAGTFVCPDCYGDGYCQCGGVLTAGSDVSECDECSADDDDSPEPTVETREAVQS